MNAAFMDRRGPASSVNCGWRALEFVRLLRAAVEATRGARDEAEWNAAADLWQCLEQVYGELSAEECARLGIPARSDGVIQGGGSLVDVVRRLRDAARCNA
jgi:hypothetical protein